MVDITYHAHNRIMSRLNKLVTEALVLAKVGSKVDHKRLPYGQSYVEIRRCPFTEIKDDSVVPDGIARGDMVVAVVEMDDEGCRIKTVVLRKSWSMSTEYQLVR